MEFSEEQRNVGREGFVLWENEIKISVIIRDVRPKHRTVDYLIEPTAGIGKRWIEGNQVFLV